MIGQHAMAPHKLTCKNFNKCPEDDQVSKFMQQNTGLISGSIIF
jgi:hypothetical protein